MLPVNRQRYPADFQKKSSSSHAVYAEQGDRYLRDGTYEDALACFSYGHGWLDAGVTAGLFTITDHHDLLPCNTCLPGAGLPAIPQFTGDSTPVPPAV